MGRVSIDLPTELHKETKVNSIRQSIGLYEYIILAIEHYNKKVIKNGKI